jgi:hypothetical protein
MNFRYLDIDGSCIRVQVPGNHDDGLSMVGPGTGISFNWETIELHQLWYPLRQLLRELGQPQTTKAVMHLRGWFGGHVRPPLQDLNEQEVARVREVLSVIARNPESGLREFVV